MTTTAFPPLSPAEPSRVFGAPMLHTEADLLALGVASDGTLWSVEEPGLLRQWSLATRRQLNQWTLDEEATVWAFNWSGRLLASGSNEVGVWEISSGEQLVGWPADSWVTALAFQPFVPVLAAGHDDGAVRVWDWADRKLLREFDHDSPVSAVAFTWDRTRLASAGEDRLIHLWDLTTGKKVGTLEGHTDRIPALTWHPDNRRLFSAGWDTTVRVWDALSRQPVILLNSHASQVHAMALSGDGKLLASADSGQAVHVWDADSYRTLQVLRQRSGGEARVVCFTPDDGKGNLTPPLLASGGIDRVINLWNSNQTSETADVDPLLSRVGVAVSPDGGRLYSLGGGTDLRGWEVETGQPVLSLAHTPVLRSMAASPDGKWIAVARLESPGVKEDRGTLSLYDATTGTRRTACDGQVGPLTSLAFNAGGTLLASGGVQSCDVWLWDVPSGRPSLILTDAVDLCSVQALAFQPKGGLLAVAGVNYLATTKGQSDGLIALWDPARKQGTLVIKSGATALGWSPDGRRLAAASLRRVVRVHDAGSGDVLLELQGHTDTVNAIAYSPDGNWLATGADDRAVRLWDAGSGEQAGAWELDNQIKALCFAPDGRWLFTGNSNTSCYQIEVEQLLDPRT